MDKRFLAVVGVIIVAFIGFAVANRDSSNTGSSGDAKPTNHVKGENAKQITLVEYGDFQCPVCALYEPTVKEVYEKYKGDIQFQFRHFPIQTAHENALAASRAAEAAAIQGKFWEMHDLLYANQTSWARSQTPQTFYEQYAQQIGLNVDQYKTDFASSKVNDLINADAAEGSRVGVDGTPSFFLNGKKIPNSELSDQNQPSLEKFSKVIDEAIAAKQQ